MSINIWNLEWLNHNSQRSYPIADWATKACTESPETKIPDDFILAVSLAVNSAHSINIDQFYIKSLLVMETGCSIILGYEDQEVAITHIKANSDQTTYLLTGLNDFSDMVGYIAVNTKSEIMNSVSGYYNFSREATCLEPDCIRPMVRTVSSIFVTTDTFSMGEALTGDIILKAGANMDIRVSALENGGHVIALSAVDTSGLSEECPCEVDNKQRPNITAIKTINGEVAGGDGAVTIAGAECLQITPTDSGLLLEDTCAEPCCGCAELDALYDNVKSFIDGATTLNNAVNELVMKQDQIEMIYNSEGRVSCCNINEEN